MPTMDKELVIMSRRRYDEMCSAIDRLTKRLKKPVFLPAKG